MVLGLMVVLNPMQHAIRDKKVRVLRMVKVPVILYATHITKGCEINHFKFQRCRCGITVLHYLACVIVSAVLLLQTAQGMLTAHLWLTDVYSTRHTHRHLDQKYTLLTDVFHTSVCKCFALSLLNDRLCPARTLLLSEVFVMS